jgi:glycosyltransferase involved in cell wall biosynthesis
MKIIQTVPGVLEKASGATVVVLSLCNVLSINGIKVELHVNLGQKPKGLSCDFFSHGRWKFPPRLDWSPKMYHAIKGAANDARIVHTHGLWNMTNIYSGWAIKNKNCRFVVSPHGTLNIEAKKKSPWKKMVLWHLWQRKVLEKTDCFHATSFVEYEAIREVGLKVPVALIPNGVDIPDVNIKNDKKENQQKKILFLSRITPIKKLDNLLYAWAVIQHKYTKWDLFITGVDDRGHEAEMKKLSEKLGLERVIFTGPAYDQDKENAFHEADLFILPTQSENFGMAVAEALAYSVPVITTKGAPWGGLQAHRCGWWIEVGVEPLVECLKIALTESPETLREMGARGRAWMEQDFSWQEVGRKMKKTYEWVINKGNPPEWVKMD